MKKLQRIALLIFFFSINFEVYDPFHTGGIFSVSKLTGYIYLFMMIPLIIRNTTSNKIKHLLSPVLVFFFGLLTLVSILISILLHTDFSIFPFFRTLSCFGSF